MSNVERITRNDEKVSSVIAHNRRVQLMCIPGF